MKIKNIFLMILLFVAFILRFSFSNEIITNIGGFIILYYILIGNILLIKEKLNLPIYKAIPLSFIITALLLVLFGYLNILLLGLILISILGLISFIKNTKNEKLSFFFTKEIGFFTFLFAVLFIANYFVNFNVWDEYSYWSGASKNYYLSNSINFSKINILPYGNRILYPPSPTIFQYFFAKIFGSYRQGFELLASQMLGFSLLFVLFEFAKKNYQKILIAIICICIPAIFCQQLFYYTIYVDTLLGLITGYGLISICSNEKYSKLSFSLALILVTLTKASGFMFSCIMILFYVMKYFIDSLNEDKKISSAITKCFKNKFIYISVLIIFATLCGNKIYYKFNPSIDNNIISGNVTNETVGSIGNAIKSTIGALTGYEYTDFSHSITTSVDDLLTRKTYSSEPFDLSAYNWIIIISLIIFVSSLINKKNDKETYSILLSLLASIISYIVLLQLAYLFMFDIREALTHNSTERYLGSMLLASFFFAIYYFIKQCNNKKALIGITLFVMLFTPVNSIIKNTIVIGERNVLTRSYLVEEQEISALINKHVKNSNELLTFNQGANNHLLKVIYFSAPKTTVSNTINFDKKTYRENNMNKMIKEHKYILILRSDDFLNKQFNKLFNQEIEEMTLYKNNNSKLEKLN